MALLLAAAGSSGGSGSGSATAGIGLLVFLGLAAACFFLFRSMTKQLKKVPDSFDEPRLPEPADPADDALAAAALQHPQQTSERPDASR